MRGGSSSFSPVAGGGDGRTIQVKTVICNRDAAKNCNYFLIIY
jgi:hypothetical protein